MGIIGAATAIATLAEKTLTSTYWPGGTVTVTGSQIAASPLVYEFTAVAGQSKVTKQFTVGSVSQPVMLTASSLQSEVDGYRQNTADLAASEEQARLAAASIT